MIRIGQVQSVEGTRARVFFPDLQLMSDRLYVLQHPATLETTEAQDHTHKVDAGRWAPAIGDVVLCLYDDSFNGNGYILGVIA